MSPAPDDLSSLKDDMIAFIEGHGMRRHAVALKRALCCVELVAIASIENHLGTGTRQPFRDSESEAAARAGDQRAPATQVERMNDWHGYVALAQAAQRKPRTSCMSYRRGSLRLSATKRAARKAPCAKFARDPARWVSSMRSPSPAKMTV